MRLEIGQTGTMKWQDGTSAKVKVVGKETYSTMPTDYWFEYQEGETNKQLVHPDYGKHDFIKSEILLPEGLIGHLFVPDKPEFEEDSFEAKLENYLRKNFNAAEREQASLLFSQLERRAGRKYIEDNYFNK